MCGTREIGAVMCEIAYSILNKTNASQAMLHAKNINTAHLSFMPGYTIGVSLFEYSVGKLYERRVKVFVRSIIFIAERVAVPSNLSTILKWKLLFV